MRIKLLIYSHTFRKHQGTGTSLNMETTPSHMPIYEYVLFSPCKIHKNKFDSLFQSILIFCERKKNHRACNIFYLRWHLKEMWVTIIGNNTDSFCWRGRHGLSLSFSQLEGNITQVLKDFKRNIFAFGKATFYTVTRDFENRISFKR